MAGEFRRVRALSARTHFVPGVGQIHFDPDSKKEDVKHPRLPVDQVELLVQRGWVADDLEADASDDLATLRAEYEAALGKRPYHAWDADELRSRIANSAGNQAPA